jgi:hypothetical protein
VKTPSIVATANAATFFKTAITADVDVITADFDVITVSTSPT